MKSRSNEQNEKGGEYAKSIGDNTLKQCIERIRTVVKELKRER